ncbi:hypothetical protein IPJ91_01555 [bacterium]|nr:MAG: hypothetical protein IPJ91_01555 [bacterium]
MQDDFNKQNSKLNEMFQSSFPEAREEFRNKLKSEVMNKLAVSTKSQVVGSGMKNIPTKITKFMSFYQKFLAGTVAAVAIFAIFLGVNSYLISNKAEPFAISKVSAMIDETLENFIYVRKYNVLPGKDYSYVINNYSTKVPSLDLELNNVGGLTFEIFEHTNSDNQYFQKKVVGGTSLIYSNGTIWLKNENGKNYLNYLNSEPNGVEYLKSLLNGEKSDTKVTSETNDRAEITVGASIQNAYGRIYVFNKSDYKVLETRYFYANETGQKYEYKVEKFIDWQKLDISEFSTMFDITMNYQLVGTSDQAETRSSSSSEVNNSSNSTNFSQSSSITVNINIIENVELDQSCGFDGVNQFDCATGLKCDTSNSVDIGGGLMGVCKKQ